MLVTEPKKIALYYQALLNRESSFVGIFYVGVTTTSVFCIATCRARKPKPENVVFYTSFKEALDHGYRPCKICKPTENADQTPSVVRKAIQMIEESPNEKVTDARLREHDISPALVRRWFKQHYGLTFHAYQRMYRVNGAFAALKKGQRATAVAFDSSYESLSGFGYTYKKLIGKSPRKSQEATIILLSRLTTPLGPMLVGATERGICLLEFTDRRMLETEFRDLQKLLRAPIMAGNNQHVQQAKLEIREYFNGQRTTFDVALHTPGTDFQNLVWKGLTNIKYGTTSTYQQQANCLGKPTAIRAVAAANGGNRVAIIIPCHRVVGKNGLIGYGGGLERKQWLLEHERQHIGK